MQILVVWNTKQHWVLTVQMKEVNFVLSTYAPFWSVEKSTPASAERSSFLSLLLSSDVCLHHLYLFVLLFGSARMPLSFGYHM